MSGSNRPIRVLVVEDSAPQRGWLLAVLESDPELEVVGWAGDGASAVLAAARLKPDVITMDLRMPGMDGLEATRRIMHETPTPIVLVTAEARGENRALVTDAFKAGVLAIELKPSFGPEPARELVATVKGMARVRVLRRTMPHVAAPPAAIAAPGMSRQRLEVVAIGASTGGPQALHELLTRLPASFPVPVVVVQHMSAGFVASLVDWLDPQCALPVRLGEAGCRLDRPMIHFAPSGSHMVVRRRVLQLTQDPPVGGHRPSVTTLLQSVALDYGSGAVGVLLTGMGEDGAAGLRDLKRGGAITVAQDAASCVVYGMPAAAINLGVVDHALPPAQIGLLLDRLTRLASSAPGGVR